MPSWSVLQSAGNNASSGTTITLSFPGNCTAGTKLICLTCNGGSGTIACHDSHANNLTSLATVNLNNTAGSGTLTLFALDTPAADAGTAAAITVTRTSGNFVALIIQEVSGLLTGNTSAMLDGTAATSFGSRSSGSQACGSYSSTASGEYLFAGYGDNENASMTIGTPTGSTTYTRESHSQQANANFASVAGYGSSTGGAETASFTVSGSSASPNGTIFVAFKLAPVAGGPPQLTAPRSPVSRLNGPVTAGIFA
jgi:hypothetical protein